MREVDIQTLLVEEVETLGGHAFKAANRFKKGILDLSVQLPGHNHVYIEVKFQARFVRQIECTLGLTRHQRNFIVEHEQAGGCVGWLMVVGFGRGTYVMDCGLRIPDSGKLYYDADSWLIKQRGGKWPIEQIVKNLQR